MNRKTALLLILILFSACNTTRKIELACMGAVVLHILQLNFIKLLLHPNGGSVIHWLRSRSSQEIFLPSYENLYAYKHPLQTVVRVNSSLLTILLLLTISQQVQDDDWARIPLTPMAAQVIADSFHCFLPTRKMVNDIYEQATRKNWHLFPCTHSVIVPLPCGSTI